MMITTADDRLLKKSIRLKPIKGHFLGPNCVLIKAAVCKVEVCPRKKTDTLYNSIKTLNLCRGGAVFQLIKIKFCVTFSDVYLSFKPMPSMNPYLKPIIRLKKNLIFITRNTV